MYLKMLKDGDCKESEVPAQSKCLADKGRYFVEIKLLLKMLSKTIINKDIKNGYKVLYQDILQLEDDKRYINDEN